MRISTRMFIFTGAVTVAAAIGLYVIYVCQKAVGGLHMQLMIFSFIIMVLSALLGGWSTYKSAKKVNKITSSIDKISKGDFSEEMGESLKQSDDEIGELARAFDRTSKSLKIAILKTGLSKEQLNLGAAIEAKQEAEAKYKFLAENATDVIYTMDIKQNITYASPSAEELLGYTHDELMHMNAKDFLELPSFKKQLKSMKKAVIGPSEEKELPEKMELCAVRKNGERIWVGANVKFILDDSHKPVGLIGIARDITERKKQEDRLKFLVSILEKSPQSVIATDKEGKITYVNSATEKLYRYSRDELLGKEPSILNAEPRDGNTHEKVLETIENTGSWRGRIMNKKKDGEIFEIEAFICQIKDREGNFIADVGFQEAVKGR